MRSANAVRAMLIMASFSLSCGSGAKAYRPTGDEKPIPLTIWIDGNAKLSEADTLKACDEWKPKGIRCFVVEDKDKSSIQVYAENEKECPKNKDDTYTLATAWRGGRIVFNMKCFGAIGKPDLHKFRAVMVHEIGHQLGIWDHVPHDCKSGKPKKHPSGKSVCGVAVMNPMYDKDVFVITVVDGLAFDIRDEFIAVVVDGPGASPDEPVCTYRGR